MYQGIKEVFAMNLPCLVSGPLVWDNMSAAEWGLASKGNPSECQKLPCERTPGLDGGAPAVHARSLPPHTHTHSHTLAAKPVRLEPQGLPLAWPLFPRPCEGRPLTLSGPQFRIRFPGQGPRRSQRQALWTLRWPLLR